MWGMITLLSWHIQWSLSCCFRTDNERKFSHRLTTCSAFKDHYNTSRILKSMTYRRRCWHDCYLFISDHEIVNENRYRQSRTGGWTRWPNSGRSWQKFNGERTDNTIKCGRYNYWYLGKNSIQWVNSLAKGAVIRRRGTKSGIYVSSSMCHSVNLSSSVSTWETNSSLRSRSQWNLFTFIFIPHFIYRW